MGKPSPPGIDAPLVPPTLLGLTPGIRQHLLSAAAAAAASNAAAAAAGKESSEAIIAPIPPFQIAKFGGFSCSFVGLEFSEVMKMSK